MSGKVVSKSLTQRSLLRNFKQLSWINIYLCQDPTKAAEPLTRYLTSLLDTMAPIRTIQVRSRYVAWLSEETKDLLKKKKTAQATATRCRDPEDWREYKNLRN